MAEGKGENLRWVFGTILGAISLVFGGSLYDTYRTRHLSYDVQPVPTPTGRAVLTVLNESDKTCGPVTLAFVANATIASARIRNSHAGDSVSPQGKGMTIETQRLAAANGRVIVDCDYKDLATPTLVLRPADQRVGCGEIAYTVQQFSNVRRTWSGLWVVMGGLAMAALAVFAVIFLLDPFRRL